MGDKNSEAAKTSEKKRYSDKQVVLKVSSKKYKKEKGTRTAQEKQCGDQENYQLTKATKE